MKPSLPIPREACIIILFSLRVRVIPGVACNLTIRDLEVGTSSGPLNSIPCHISLCTWHSEHAQDIMDNSSPITIKSPIGGLMLGSDGD